jgi:S-disulfanyl-L-cysteine oxidoreductase SoxD
MFMRSAMIPAVGLALCLATRAVAAEGPNLGKPVDQADIAAWDISVAPDGTGLPTGTGTSAQGASVYAEKCTQCHGPDGKGGVQGVTASPLVGGGPITDISAAQKTIANFWPYPTTLFDYIRRAMPWQQPRSLTNDEVYALTAFILAQNKLIGENDAMNAQTLPMVKMPNRGGFILRFPEAM